MKTHKTILLITASAVLAGLSSCSTTPSSSAGSSGNASVARYQAYDLPVSLPSNPSNVRVKVSLSNQMVYVMEGSKPLLVTPVSIGTSSTPTPRGNFKIFNKEAKRRANGHGYAYNGSQVSQVYRSKKPAGWNFIGTPMPYWTEFRSGYGFHTGWMKPHPCTHGCLRLHENISPKFFRLVSVGTPLNIANSQPEDATIGRNVPRPPDASPLPDYPSSMMIGDGYYSRHKTPSYN